jgi:hypothetical protein
MKAYCKLNCRLTLALLVHAPLLAPQAFAQTTVAAVQLDKVEISGHYDNSVGSSDSASQGVFGQQLIEARPLLRPGALLEYVPGPVVTQHSGSGKANQYFLRGFNLDHGTDFATRFGARGLLRAVPGRAAPHHRVEADVPRHGDADLGVPA